MSTKTADHPIVINPDPKRLQVRAQGRVIADTTRSLALAESTYPVVNYIPREDVDMTQLRRTAHSTHCPYKGDASYYSIVTPTGVLENAVWTYEKPISSVAQIASYLAFDRRFVD